jgi:hypothetical protein
VAVKPAVLAAAATVTELGTVISALLLVMDTVLPPEGAALLRVTVQLLPLPEASEAGLHCSEETTAGESSETEAVLDELLSVAVSAAVWSVVTAAALTVKDALLEAAGTVTDAGALRFALSLARETVAPPEGAAALKLTVHVDAPGA